MQERAGEHGDILPEYLQSAGIVTQGMVNLSQVHVPRHFQRHIT
jgi:hypothetical protein